MQPLHVSTRSGTILNGVLFPAADADAVLIAITGVHGNFYSNPFYVNIGNTLSGGGIDFIYAQTRDAFSRIDSRNSRTGQVEHLGSWNEDFDDTIDDVRAYVDYAEQAGYKRIFLAGHSVGANKVIRYLSETRDPRVDRFILLSPANIKHLTSTVTAERRELVRGRIAAGQGQGLLPFDLFGWLPCTADTAAQWIFGRTLDNVHVESDRDFSQVESIPHTGALVIGTYDRFTYGDPAGFLATINQHFPHADDNELILLQETGHTYQHKEQELAERLLRALSTWSARD